MSWSNFIFPNIRERHLSSWLQTWPVKLSRCKVFTVAYAPITHTPYWDISTRIGDYFDSRARVFSPCWTQNEAGPCCSRATPGLFPCYSRVISVLSHVRPCYLSGHGSQATQNVPYSSILSALTRIKPCCSRVVPVLLPCCPVLSRVALYVPMLIQVIPVLFLGY